MFKNKTCYVIHFTVVKDPGYVKVFCHCRRMCLRLICCICLEKFS